MAEQSMLWTTNGTGHGVGTGYASNRWQALLRKLFLSDQAAVACVLNQVDNELAVSGTASPLSVATGAAIDYGFFYENDAPKNLTVTTPVVGTTGGHVILEANWTAQTVTALAVRNTDGLSAIPTLTQIANTTWQVRLATFQIATSGVITLTDVRKRTKFSNHVYAGGFDSSAVDTTSVILNGAGALKSKHVQNRQGGNSVSWHTPGTTDYVAATSRVQAGVRSVNSGNTLIGFPVEFAAAPLVIAANFAASNTYVAAVQSTVTSGSFEVYASGNTTIVWIAIGQEA